MIGLAESVVGVAGKVLDKFVEDKDLRTKLEHELKTEMIALDMGQIQIGIEQAKSPSLFVSGARPAIMWLCAFGLGWQFIGNPIMVWAVSIWAPDIPIPEISTEGLMGLTLSLLGLSGMRTAEKFKGTARENMRATK